MTEHNLPDKDDAPWLDTTYDGFNEEQALKALDKLHKENTKGMKELSQMTDYEAQMLHDFENRWEVRHKLLNRVKDDLFPGCSWRHLHPEAVAVINNIVESLAGK